MFEFCIEKDKYFYNIIYIVHKDKIQSFVNSGGLNWLKETRTKPLEIKQFNH